MRRREKKLGREAANAYWRLTERYVDRMEELAGDALHRVGSLRLADDEELDEAIRPVRGQVIATEPLGQMRYPCPHYARRGFDYWQQTPDTRLVLGGRRDKDLELENTKEEAITDSIQAS
jgi:hypothetical protein